VISTFCYYRIKRFGQGGRQFTLGNLSQHVDMFLCSFKFSLQTGAFSSELCNKLDFGVNVLIWLILNVRSFGSVVKSTDVFLRVGI